MEIGGTASDSAKRIIDLEANLDRLQWEERILQVELKEVEANEARMKEKCRKLKGKRVRIKEGFNSEQIKWREEADNIEEKFWQVVTQKKKLDIDLEAAKDEVEHLKGLVKERDASVTDLLGKVEDLEKRNSKLDYDLKAVKMRSQELEKARISGLLSFLGEENGTSGAVEIKEEMVIESNADAGVLEYNQKKAMGNGNSESSTMFLECQKSSEPHKSVDQADIQLEGHNRQTFSPKVLCNNKEVSISTTPAKSKDSDNVQISGGSNNECVDRIITKCTTTEPENLTLEIIECTPAAASQSIAVNSVVPQRRKVEALGCSIEMQIGNKHYKPVSSQSIPGIECTSPAASKSIAGTFVVPQRRKMEVQRYSIEKHIEIKQDKLGGHLSAKLKWESASKMFNAFTTNHELCMRSVCALYRKHKSLGQWNSCSSSSNGGFKPQHETRGMALGELLTNGDPEGLMKKSLAEFKRADPRGPEDCRRIARFHHMELFQIYKNNLDPLFKPDENI